jgi:2-succinyl-5-enolpyruvyl-6-hydroxy-3-cyclohexene-1-carboxylate synthase
MTNLHVAWARLFVSSLATAGVRDVVISPGSRSTPLVLAAAGEPRVACRAIVDERSAAFFALGQARVTGRPSALICTSGSAAAHYLPAIVEAREAGVPLVAITADRPWELHDAGAAQTIDQRDLFGDRVRARLELGEPDGSLAALRACARVAAQAVHASSSTPRGPVHVNARFRKPLEPIPNSGAESWADALARVEAEGAPRLVASAPFVDAAIIGEIAAACARARRGVIACGPMPVATDRAAIVELARATGFPLFAEAPSQLRFGGTGDDVPACAAFDALLRAPAFRARYRADFVLELGAPLTSSAYASYVAEPSGCTRVIVAPDGARAEACTFVRAEPGEFAAALVAALATARATDPIARDWRDALALADAAAWRRIDRDARADELTEATVARRVVEAVPAGGVLVVANSNPIRDVDTFAPATARPIRVVHQRGAAGIDGAISSAAGAASVAGAPTVLLVGDLAALHDLGGLAIAARATTPLAIVIANNAGGRLFEQLPVAERADARAFAELFIAEQRVDFAAAAAAFAIEHVRPRSADALAAALAAALARPACTVVEACVPPRDGTTRRARLRADIAAEVA